MPARGMVNQQLLIQREVTPGVPLVNAMKRIQGLKGRVAWNNEGDDFAQQGSKINTARIETGEWANFSLEAIQDYNANLWALCGGYGAPEAPVPAVTDAVTAKLHRFELHAFEPDPLATFNVIWGDGSQALQIAHTFFNSLGIGIERRSLSLDVSAMGYTPVTGIALPTTGIVTIPSKAIVGRSWSVYLDDAEEDLGTTKLVAVYRGGLTFPDKYAMDWTVNAARPSFDSIIETENTKYEGELRLGLQADAVALVGDISAGDLKYLRLESIGPVIETVAAVPVPYRMTIDACLRVISPGEVSAAPGAPSVSLPFSYQLTPDPVSGFTSSVELVNVVASL